MELLNKANNLENEMIELYNEIWKHRDKRVDGWFMMSSPVSSIVVCLFYVYLVKVWGPNFMKNREPINCQSFMLVYNTFQVLLSLYVVIHGIMAGWITEYSFFCEPLDHTEKGDYMVFCVWIVHISKYIDFIDTFCFIARKKFNQVSALHVYHHSIMPLSIWIMLRFLPGGHGTFAGFINAIVHVIMYTYYLISGLGPHYQKYIWWKSYVTKIQLIQFVLVMIHSFQLLFKNECNYPMFSAYFNMAHAVIFFALFGQFYIMAYLSAKNKKGLKNAQNNNKDSDKIEAINANNSKKTN